MNINYFIRNFVIGLIFFSVVYFIIYPKTGGGALLKAVEAGASVSNIRYTQILQDLAKQGFLSEKDKALFSQFLQAPAPAPASPAPQNLQQNNPAVAGGGGFGFRV